MTNATCRVISSAVLVAASAAVVACGVNDKNKARMEAAIDSVSRSDTVAAGGEVLGSSAAANAPTAPAMSEASLVSLLVAANAAEVSAAQLAKTRASSKDVKDFADELIDDHKGFQKKVDDAAKDAHLTPGSSTAADSLRTASAAAADSLKTLSGGAFDRAWTAHMVADHQRTLASLQALQGSAASEDLREALSDGIRTVQEHLQKAQDLEKKLGTGAR